MNDNRMPTLFEILNRFSKPPVDLWSFYIFLKEQYGGVEYLEFWIDCAAYSAVYQEIMEGVKYRLSQSDISEFNEESRFLSRDSSVLFDMLNESPETKHTAAFNPSVLAMAGTAPSGSGSGAGLSAPMASTHRDSGVFLGPLEELPLEDPSHHAESSLNLNLNLGLFSDDDDKHIQQKRDTIYRLSNMLKKFGSPRQSLIQNKSQEYIDVNSHSRSNSNSNSNSHSNAHNNTHAHSNSNSNSDKRASNSSKDQRSSNYDSQSTSLPHSPESDVDDETRRFLSNPASPAAGVTTPSGFVAGHPGGFPSHLSVTRKTMHECVKRIVAMYLTPGAEKEIELPSSQYGWSIAGEIRELIAIPGGLDTPDIFEKATTYVFEVLEREALPAFLVSRALSNIQPVSATLRLVSGLLGLFAAFWLSFTGILLDWNSATRCWVLLPFVLGWYFTCTALYHIDPILSFAGYGECDGGGLMLIQERFVYGLLFRRGVFVLSAIKLLTACFAVLFIFVPGHRLYV